MELRNPYTTEMILREGQVQKVVEFLETRRGHDVKVAHMESNDEYTIVECVNCHRQGKVWLDLMYMKGKLQLVGSIADRRCDEQTTLAF